MATTTWFSKTVLIAALSCAFTNAQSTTNYIVGYWQGSGSIDVSHLTHLNYAFAVITGSGSNTTCQLNGNATTLTSNFQSFKAANPNLKILVSIGGAGQSPADFTAASQTSTFASNCVAQTLGLLGGTADGIDIDWEFPSSSDPQNFVNLMAAFRSALPGKLLTAAVGMGPTNNGSPAQNANVPFAQLLNTVDFFNIMTYDAYSTAATTFGAPLYASSLSGYGTYNGTVNDTIVDLLTTKQVPASKIVLGLPFYGISYPSVPVQGINAGMYQTPVQKTVPDPDNPSRTKSAYAVAIAYNQIVSQISRPTASKYCDTGAVSPAACPQTWGQPLSAAPTSGSQETWIYDSNGVYGYGPSVTTFDDAGSIAAKVKYAVSKGLRGVMVWELTQDTASHTLLNAIVSSMPANTSNTGNNGGGNQQPTGASIFDFENGDAQSWTRTGGVFSVYSTTDKANTGSSSLKLAFITYRQTYQPNGTVWVQPPAAVRPGSTVSFRLWVPANAAGNLTAIMPFFMDKNWSWTDNTYALSDLTLGAWNTISIRVPANAVTDFTQIGIQFEISKLWNGELFLDTVTVQ